MQVMNPALARSLLKEPKIYFSGYVDGDEGVQLENTVATCLLKHTQYLHDAKGIDISLHYIRTKEGKEIDFAFVKEKVLTHFIEIKLSDNNISPNLRYFKNKHSSVEAIQLIHNLRNDIEVNGISVLQAGRWLSQLDA
jgi:predicted AAA+ superfamily ATPase